jgi:hypothetical protein
MSEEIKIEDNVAPEVVEEAIAPAPVEELDVTAEPEVVVEDIAPAAETSEVSVEEDNVVSSKLPEVKAEPKSSLDAKSGVFKAKEPKKKAVKEEPAVKTVAVYSGKNLHWAGVGSLVRGYSIVSEAVAEKWIAKSSNVRLATPEEVAKEFGL